MAAVNNLAAAFGSCKITNNASPTIRMFPSMHVVSMATKPCVSWNPQSRIPTAIKPSFLGLYGGPGPRPITPLKPKSKRTSTHVVSASPISVGDTLPEATLSYLDEADNVQTVKVSELTKGKKVVLFAVPGAFTPTCSQKHVPQFVAKADELKAKGVDTIACVSVNDVFVMKAWGKDLNVGDKVMLLSDGNGELTKALGVSLDLSDKPVGLGVRSRRYALVADDGVVKVLKLEEGGAFTISSADDIFKAL